MDKLAAEGMVFTNAYAPNAKCAPSRSCIVTGRNSWQLEAGNQPVSRGHHRAVRKGDYN
ncbi:MAG: sulfatase-like hydrolase/transferase [Draconibacterium sp.]|nr:sulfatase-like hydrolase/transferase [Draconibacterium sp.]